MCNNQNCRRMKTTLLVVGRTVEQHYITAINDYIQRTKRYITFDMEVIPELKNTKSLSMEQQKEKEGELISKTGLPGVTFCPNRTNDLEIRPAKGEAISA